MSTGLTRPEGPRAALRADRWLPASRSRFIALLLLVSAVWLAVLFWRVPVDDPLTVSALLLDRTLQVATIVGLPLSVLLTLLAPLGLARLGAAAGGALSVLLGSSCALAALRPPIDPWPTILAVASSLAGVALLVWVLHRIVTARRWVVSLLAAVPLVTAIQFWHQTSFVPARLSTSVTLEPRVVV
jgi:hypothetical protein